MTCLLILSASHFVLAIWKFSVGTIKFGHWPVLYDLLTEFELSVILCSLKFLNPILTKSLLFDSTVDFLRSVIIYWPTDIH